MKALVWEGPRQLTVRDVADARAGSGEVLIGPVAAGVCGSEVEGYLGRQANRTPPLMMGHELAGMVLAAGDGADNSWVGQLVAVNPIVSCRDCRYCAAGARNLCRRKGLIGVARPGGFAERVAVPAANLTRLPEGTDGRLGAFIEPMANGVHAARLGLAGQRDARAIVIGAGAIGLCAVQALRLLGAGQIDVLEPGARRRELSRDLGASAVHESADQLREAVGAASGPRGGDDDGADVVIDAVGAAATRQLAADVTRPHGKVILIGMHDDGSELAFRPIVRDEIVLSGCYAYTDEDFSCAAEWVAGGRAGPGDLTPARPLSDGPEVFALLAGGGAEQPVRIFLGHG